MPIPPDVVKCFKYIDLQSKNFIEELRQIIKIPNVSSNPVAKGDLITMIYWMSNRLKQLGFQTQLKEPDYEKYKGNKPFIIIASLGNCPKKKTLLYYCHLDVLKVYDSNWKNNPFEMIQMDGKLYGRGTAKMKGPLLCFIHAIESYVKVGIEVPVNIKIICESMNECRSKGLVSILNELKATFLSKVDCVLLTDSHWLGKEYPCIIYGTRGVCYFNVIIEGPNRNLDSGNFGGIIYEPMQDLLNIINGLIDSSGHINIPHFYDDVVRVTPEEEKIYEKIKVSVHEYKQNVGVNHFGHNEDMKTMLMHVWRHPWLNLHYIKSSCDDCSTLDIPSKIFCRFSIRIVPNQRYEIVSKLVIDYIHELIKKLKTPNKIVLDIEKSSDPWYEDNQHWNYQAAIAATKQVYKEEVSLIREGNGFPILLNIRNALPKRNILMLPIVSCEAKTHTEEENISLRCYIEGTKLLASYLYELNVVSTQLSLSMKNPPKNICRNKLTDFK
ncbi:PREDICTED: cytosolic non-specific dipeptidase-like [Ceratosolen solmsi marchali]|uniref:Cytosolic non-specific dipeptidase-like n=1 Tax=Ceratosolen solmsi marchali TaxID=326594 RepID=A0AAJ7E0I9_9HYME|nr:PREDICTED: cytosolic non-specific dipeptidase-like [Ceratosolen solmsi marchali]